MRAGQSILLWMSARMRPAVSGEMAGRAQHRSSCTSGRGARVSILAGYWGMVIGSFERGLYTGAPQCRVDSDRPSHGVNTLLCESSSRICGRWLPWSIPVRRTGARVLLQRVMTVGRGTPAVLRLYRLAVHPEERHGHTVPAG